MTTTTFTPPATAASSPVSGLRTLLEDYGEKLERRSAELAAQASLEEQLITVNAQELELEAELEGVLNAKSEGGEAPCRSLHQHPWCRPSSRARST